MFSELETSCVKKRKHQQVLIFYHFAAAFKPDSRKTDFDANLLMI